MRRRQSVVDLDDLRQEAELARLEGGDPVKAVWKLLRKVVREGDRTVRDVPDRPAPPAGCPAAFEELVAALPSEALRRLARGGYYDSGATTALRRAAPFINREDYQ